MNTIACVDADCVILDFISQWERAVEERLGRKIGIQSNHYQLGIRYGLTEDETNIVWDHFNQNDLWATIPEIPGAVDAVKKLQSYDYQVHIITRIEQIRLNSRMDNFEAIGLPMLPVHIVKESKEPILRRLGAHVFFDDNPEHINEALAAGVEHRIHIFSHENDQSPLSATARFNKLHQAVDHFLESSHYTQGIQVTYG